jgi:hypothetical protein
MKKILSILMALIILCALATPVLALSDDVTSVRLSNTPTIDLSVSGRSITLSGLKTPKAARFILGGAEYPITVSGDTAYIVVQKGITDGVYTLKIIGVAEVWTSLYVRDTGETLAIVTPDGYDEYRAEMTDYEKGSWTIRELPNDSISLKIRQEAVNLTRNISGYKAKLDKLYENLVNKGYSYDKSLLNITPADLWTKSSGTCKAFSEYLDLQAREIGIPSQLIIGLAKKEDSGKWESCGDDVSSWGKHQWNVFRIDGKVIVADPTWDAIWRKAGNTNLRFYNTTDFVFSISHAPQDTAAPLPNPYPQPNPIPLPNPTPIPAPAPQTHASGAVYAHKPIVINGAKVSLDTYTLNGVTYVKPRDLFYALRDTDPVDFFWSNDNAAYMMVRGYQSSTSGDELVAYGLARDLTPATITAVVQYNSVAKWQDFNALNADGEWFFALRELAGVAGASVNWDGTNIRIN